MGSPPSPCLKHTATISLNRALNWIDEESSAVSGVVELRMMNWKYHKSRLKEYKLHLTCGGKAPGDAVPA
jgi:hypothetical protein